MEEALGLVLVPALPRFSLLREEGDVGT